MDEQINRKVNGLHDDLEKLLIEHRFGTFGTHRTSIRGVQEWIVLWKKLERPNEPVVPRRTVSIIVLSDEDNEDTAEKMRELLANGL